jgi:glycosyltransferase involved in cell wall biosynthesis
MGRRSVSIVMPTMNRRVEVGSFLDTLLRQTVPADELVVVDAGQDRVLDLLEARLRGTGIVLRYATSRPGTSVQRNLGIEMATQDTVFFLDDDVLLEPDFIERMLEAFDFPAQPPVGAVLATFSNPNFRSGLGIRVARGFGLTNHDRGDRSIIYPSGAVRWLQAPSTIVPVPAAATGRCAYLREALAVERFEEFLPGYTLAEDLHLSRRVARAWTLVQTPHARVFHKKSAANRGGMGDRAARVVFSHYYLFRTLQPRSPKTLAAFAWSNVGLVALQVGGAVGKGQLLPVLRGLGRGFKLCWRDARAPKGAVTPGATPGRG